jgi:hypothetical protein
MNAPHLPVVRYRTAKPRDRQLGSLGQGNGPVSHRTTLTLGPVVSGRKSSHRLATEDSTIGPVATIRTETGLKGPQP